MDFIDTHLHLIDRDKLGYGWTAGIPRPGRQGISPWPTTPR